MSEQPYYTTFKISQICGVNPTTVQNWVKEKKLRAFQTPGGHRRIRREDLVAFLKKFGMPVPAELAGSSPLVMIVDDEADILDPIGEWMQSGSDEVEIAKARSGIEALLMIGERKPDILILDLRMPGMDGYEVCRKLKSNPGTQNIKIVAISGDHDSAVKERILEAGADLFFTKPIDLVELQGHCYRLLGMKTERE